MVLFVGQKESAGVVASYILKVSEYQHLACELVTEEEIG